LAWSQLVSFGEHVSTTGQRRVNSRNARLRAAGTTRALQLEMNGLVTTRSAHSPAEALDRLETNADAKRMAAMMSETLRGLLLCIGLVVCVACASASPLRQVIASPQAPAALGAYSQGIRVGTTAYLAGQLPLDPNTLDLILDPSIEAQTRQALENLRAVLAADQMTLDNLVSTQVFVTDIAEAPRMNAVYATYFTKLAPARVVVQVAGLARNARIEISAIAVK
jgi:2-iminobutanoate/2-iminopropanoate deaminase